MAAPDSERPVYMISVAAELAGMHPQTLRIYEQRGLIEPNRSPKGTRLYSQEDVERLRRIQELTSELGMNLAGVERVFELEGELEQMRRRMDRLERRAEQMRKRVRGRGRPRPAELPARARAVRAAGAGADAARRTTPSGSRCGGRERRQMHADRFTIKSQEALAAAQKLAAAKRNPQVDPLHLLVSLLEQEGGIVVPVLRRANADPEAVRRRANEQLDALPTVTGDATQAPALDQRMIETLNRADEEARGFGDEYVSTEHLLLALASDPKIDVGAARDVLADAVQSVRGPHRVTDQNPEDKYQALEKFGRDLTEAAEQGKLDPVIGRDDEIRRVIQVLSRRTKNNPVLIGEPGTGKTAIVEGLAQRIVSATCPTRSATGA